MTKATALTVNEFAELSLVYLVRYTQVAWVTNFAALGLFLTTQWMPFLPNITRENSSYLHIIAQGCGTIEGLQRLNLRQALVTHYGGTIGRGFDRAQLESHLPAGQQHVLDQHIVPSLHDNSKLQPNARNKVDFLKRAADSGLTPDQLTNVWSLFEGTIPSEDDLTTLLANYVPGIRTLFQIWNETPLAALALNTVGIAIGHANAVRTIGLNAELNIWIK